MHRKLNVLVIDDEQIVLDSVKKHLIKNEEYIVYTALTAQDALEQISLEGIDIILTDLMMPEIDGLELIKIIKETQNSIPIIMITGYATKNTALQAMQLGAFDYIAKPFSKAELKSVVSRAAEIVLAADKAPAETKEEKLIEDQKRQKPAFATKSTGENTWLTIEEDGKVRLGVEHPFLSTIGHVQTVHLPDKGDVLRQGSAMAQLFTNDMCSYHLHSPISGEVIEVNEKLDENPSDALEDPYEKGWLLRIDPSNLDDEVKVLDT
ncbi:MAG: response regulator [Candidatus Electryonea clarkiae]|nr:response regulator [Candidatus Electryonea clarkiae]MDP8285506.1 response regulator [Candidatus Electryonea clarkiae]